LLCLANALPAAFGFGSVGADGEGSFVLSYAAYFAEKIEITEVCYERKVHARSEHLPIEGRLYSVRLARNP